MLIRRSGTLHIGPKAAQTNYYTRQQATRLGLPLTHAVTINFGSTAIDPREAVACFSLLRRNYFNKWATRPRKGTGGAFVPTYAFAFENVRNGTPFLTMEPGDPHNVHVHWELHLPASRAYDFEMAVWNWVERVTGGITGGAEAIKITQLPVTPTGYLVKGTTPAFARLYGRGRPAEPQGIIVGRRADTSRNLGPKARREMDRQHGIVRRMPTRQRSEPPEAHPSSA